MKRSLSLWQFVGFSLTSFLGTLFHFLYEWTGESPFVAPISGVNESTWEHMKLLFFPLFFFALVERAFFREQKNFWQVKLCGTLRGILWIPFLFYTLNGAFGKTPDWVNISLFFLAAALSFLWETRAFSKAEDTESPVPRLSFFLLCLIGALFVLFTFFPPRIPLFADPLTGTYGIQ